MIFGTHGFRTDILPDTKIGLETFWFGSLAYDTNIRISISSWSRVFLDEILMDKNSFKIIKTYNFCSVDDYHSPYVQMASFVFRSTSSVRPQLSFTTTSHVDFCEKEENQRKKTLVAR